jgi:hypothetical protein
MPDWRVPRVSIPVGPLSAAVALAALLALAPAANPVHAQGGPDYGPHTPGMHPHLLPGAPGYTQVMGELAVAGQTQVCQESPMAQANYGAFYGPLYGTVPGPLWGFPWYAHTNLVPYGGFWGFYTGAGVPVCLWQPR